MINRNFLLSVTTDRPGTVDNYGIIKRDPFCYKIDNFRLSQET